MLRKTLAITAMLVLPVVSGPGPGWADGTPVRIRGTVVSLDGSKLLVQYQEWEGCRGELEG
jgi:hypothetical protein